MTTYWLSFADEKEFAGVIVVDVGPGDLEEDEAARAKLVAKDARWLKADAGVLAAIGKTIRMGINPGEEYSVLGARVPGDRDVPGEYKNRLLDESEADRAARALDRKKG
jgi:hypothetical protein